MAATIFVDTRARVEAWRSDIADRSIRRTPANHDAAGFRGSQLRPVEFVAVPANHLVAELHGALEQQVDGDGRSPGSVRSDPALAHECGRLMMRASPWPPPPQSAAAPVRSPRRLSSSATVSTRRAPLAPIGWPSATAPPLTLTRSASISSIRVALSATAANASLNSTRSRFLTSRP